MNASKTQAFVIGFAVGVIVGVVGTLIHSSAPRDTPIVIVGGSIHHDTDKDDTTGWQVETSQASYFGVVHHDASNTNGINYLAFAQYNDDKGNPFGGPITNTGGWAIQIADAKQKQAVKLCSDSGCTASSDLSGSARCSKTFSAFAPVYLGVIDSGSTWLEEKTHKSIIDELRYHNKNGDCDGGGSTESACDMVSTLRVDTCTPLQSRTLTCTGKGCTLTIGKK